MYTHFSMGMLVFFYCQKEYYRQNIIQDLHKKRSFNKSNIHGFGSSIRQGWYKLGNPSFDRWKRKIFYRSFALLRLQGFVDFRASEIEITLLASSNEGLKWTTGNYINTVKIILFLSNNIACYSSTHNMRCTWAGFLIFNRLGTAEF